MCIRDRAEQGAVQALELTGTRYDCGDKLGYLQAITAVALQSETFGADYRAFLDRMMS